MKELREIEAEVLRDLFDLSPDEQRFVLTKVLNLNYFITAKAKAFYKILLNMISQDEPIDKVTFMQRSFNNSFTNKDEDLISILRQPDNPLYYRAHINLLKEERAKEDLKKIAEDFNQKIGSAKSLEDVYRLRDDKLKELEALDPDYKSNITKVLNNSISNYTDEYYKTLGLGNNELLGIDTGFTKLNNKIHGLRGLVILAGVPKTGKTSYALQLAFQSAERGTPVLFYSLEMSRQQLSTRILSRLSKINYIDILLKAGAYLRKEEQQTFRECFTEEELENFSMAEHRRKEANNFFIRSLEDETKIDFLTVEREIEFIKQKFNKDVLVIIDHLQIFPFDNYKDQIDKEQNLITKFNEIQKKTGSTIVLISQKNKEAFKKAGSSNNSYEMAGVKGSVDLVYLASLILTLNDSEQANNNPELKFLDLNIISRDTPGGQISLEFNGAKHSFLEL